ncbi:MAG: DUF6755 family protein, partial [Candidatus Angelobacter sp.]
MVVQLWLLAITVDALLRHESGTPLHAAIASGVLFLINGALVLYVFSFDRKSSSGSRPHLMG